MVRSALAAAMLLTAGAAGAQAPIAYYAAIPVTPATRAQLMTHATPWSLRGGAYTADRAPERDVIMCQLVAKEVGQLQSFAVAGKPLDADTLGKCNSKAK